MDDTSCIGVPLSQLFVTGWISPLLMVSVASLSSRDPRANDETFQRKKSQRSLSPAKDSALIIDIKPSISQTPFIITAVPSEKWAQ